MKCDSIMNHSTQSIYIHIPFCKSKCPYCDFASWARKEDLIEKYFNALIYEIRTKCEAYLKLSTIRTIFIGGGTPSLIYPDYYVRLFEELKRFFIIDKDCEITLELNPGTVKDEYLAEYKNLGVNRVSIGAQSFNDNILETLGRKHSVNETLEAINKTKSVGIDNFNLDFIFSVPGMTKDIWLETIYKAIELEPKHISTYSLIIEPGTPFEHIYKDPKLLPTDETAFEFYYLLCKILKENGFIHYEVSNFAKKGFECKHNLVYWLAKEYYAFGVSAHRYINGLRTCNVKDLETYIANPNLEIITDYPINYNFEKIMLTSRLNEGFDMNLIERVSTKSLSEIKKILYDLSSEGYLELSDKKVHLTDKGFFINNEILIKLL